MVCPPPMSGIRIINCFTFSPLWISNATLCPSVFSLGQQCWYFLKLRQLYDQVYNCCIKMSGTVLLRSARTLLHQLHSNMFRYKVILIMIKSISTYFSFPDRKLIGHLRFCFQLSVRYFCLYNTVPIINYNINYFMCLFSQN